jgi:pterin-4a-carbinolamine dehydratase
MTAKTTTKTPTPPTIKAVMRWILEANDERDIREAIKKEFPDADENAVLDAAVAEITAIGNENEDFTRGWALAATRELVRKMIEVGDYNNAMRGIKQVHELAGGK